MSASYPFLALARNHGVDYGLVLSFADYSVAEPGASPTIWQERAIAELPALVKKAIIKTVKLESSRCELISK